MVPLKSVLAFNDYRKYLEHFYLLKKQERSSYSFREFSKAAGLNSPNYLTLVMSGKKRLTVANIHQFSLALKLTSEEQIYFEALVLANQAKLKHEKMFYNQRLALLKTRKSTDKVYSSSRNMLSLWFLPALVLFLDGISVDETTAHLSSLATRLNISADEATRAKDKLIESSILKVENKMYRLQSNYLYLLDKKSNSIDHRRYLGQQMRLSEKALNQGYHKGHKFFAHTLRISESAVPLLDQLFVEYLNRVTALSDSENGRQLVQINAQIFRI